MGKPLTEVLKFLAGLVLIGGWAGFTLLWLFVAQFASLDEEAGSGSDFLIVTAAPILVVGAVAGGLTWLIFRPRR